jgi:hypothetical protein
MLRRTVEPQGWTLMAKTRSRTSSLSVAGAARLALAAAAMSMSGAALAQDSCVIERADFCHGCTVSRRITLKKNAGCVLNNTTGGMLIGTRTTVAPKNGRFGKADQTASAYVPRPNFVGQDYFVYVLTFESFGRTGDVTIQNRVTVTE